MASKRMTRALRSAVRKNIRGGREKKLGREQGLTLGGGEYIYRKAHRSHSGENAKANARSFLWTGNFEDNPPLRRAQKCFKNNVLKGQDSGSAYAACGLSYGDSSMAGAGRNKSSSQHRRAGIADIEGRYSDVVTSDEWVDKRS